MIRWVLSTLIAAGLAACDTQQTAQGGPGDRRGGGNRQSAAVPVKVERVERGEISKSVLKNTTLEAERWVDIRSRTQGQVVVIVKEEGDPVLAGTILARLDAAAAELQVKQMEVAYQEATRNQDRINKIFEANLVSQEQFEAAKTKRDRAEAQYEQAKLDLSYTRIISPVDGIVTSRVVEIGNVVSNNQMLFSVADFNPLLARIRVPEKEIGNIAVGQEALITVESAPGREYQGHVKMISPVVDPESGTVKVTIEIPSSGKTLLRPGMFASVYIITDTRRQTLVISKKALVLQGEGNQIFVFDPSEEGGTSVRRRIEIGFSDNNRLEVIDGISEGELVITVGQDGLRPGTAVRIVEDGSQMALQTPSTRTPTMRPGGDGTADGDGPPRRRRRVGSTTNRNDVLSAAVRTSPAVAESLTLRRGPGNDIRRFQARIFERFPEAKKIFDERVKKDPELSTNREKWRAFVRELSDKGIVTMSRRGG